MNFNKQKRKKKMDNAGVGIAVHSTVPGVEAAVRSSRPYNMERRSEEEHVRKVQRCDSNLDTELCVAAIQHCQKFRCKCKVGYNLSVADVQAVRLAYKEHANKPQFVLDEIRAAKTRQSAESHGELRYFFSGVATFACGKCWHTALGVSNGTYYARLGDVNRGVQRKVHGGISQPRRGAVDIMARFLEIFIGILGLCGQYMPHVDKVHVLTGNRKDLYVDYRQKLQENEPFMSCAHYYHVVRSKFPQVVWPKKVSFAVSVMAARVHVPICVQCACTEIVHF